MLTEAHKQFYHDNGYVVIGGLFTPDEVAGYREHYMTLRRHGAYPGDLVGADPTSNDPLKRYPRMIHMHRWDEISLRWLIDQRLNRCMSALLGREPYAVQTMLYFKPPGARGQTPPPETNPYVNGLPDDVQQALARYYADAFRVFLKHRDAITRVTFWGVSDADSWLNRGRVNHPLLWDRQRQPKPAFAEVVRVLASAK